MVAGKIGAAYHGRQNVPRSISATCEEEGPDGTWECGPTQSCIGYPVTWGVLGYVGWECEGVGLWEPMRRVGSSVISTRHLVHEGASHLVAT